MSEPKLLVTGAAGHLGRQVIEILLAVPGERTLVATTRNPAALADLAARGVDVRAANFDEPAGLEAAFVIDSAGTHGFHEGEPADPRTRKTGRRHGLDVDSIARAVRDNDFHSFDLIVAMDRGHRRELTARAGKGRKATIRLMREYDPAARDQDVPDPYYGGEEGFEAMHAILEPACRGLLDALRPR